MPVVFLAIAALSQAYADGRNVAGDADATALRDRGSLPSSILFPISTNSDELAEILALKKGLPDARLHQRL